MIGGWILARVGLDQLPKNNRTKCIAVAFSLVFITALFFGIVGTLIGYFESRSQDLSGWLHWQLELHLSDLPSFIIVVYLHWASYSGALIGVILAVIFVRHDYGSADRHAVA